MTTTRTAASVIWLIVFWIAVIVAASAVIVLTRHRPETFAHRAAHIDWGVPAIKWEAEVK